MNHSMRYPRRVISPIRQDSASRVSDLCDLCAFKIIGVRNLHQVGGPREEIFLLDEMVASNGFHWICCRNCGDAFADLPTRSPFLQLTEKPRRPTLTHA